MVVRAGFEILLIQNPVLISPDKGAKEKVKSVAEYFEHDVVYAEKVRDTKQVKSLTQCYLETDKVKDKDCVIVDDIFVTVAVHSSHWQRNLKKLEQGLLHSM